MNPKTNAAFLIILIMTSACGQPNTVEPVDFEIPTEISASVPTAEPLPTATDTRLESGYFTFDNENSVPVYQDELTPFFLPEDMTGGDMENFQLIQYGYFRSYDSESLELIMLSRIMTGNMYRELQIQLDENQKITCLPETLGDTPITDLNFPISNGDVSFPSGPGERQFNDILPNLTKTSYFVIVLTETVQADQINSVKSIAGICP